MADLLLPPSPNWFQDNAISCRETDKIVATACFKSLVVYYLSKDGNQTTLKLLKKIHHPYGKLIGLAIQPDETNSKYGKTVAAIGDHGTIAAVNFHSGEFIDHHQTKKHTFESVCWGSVDGEEAIAAVGSGGALFVWKPKCKVNSFILSKNSLTSIKAVPHDRTQALVCCDKAIYVVFLKRGEILSELKGHENPVYSLKWHQGDTNPTTVDPLPTNTRWNRDDEKAEEPKTNTRWKKDEEEQELAKKEIEPTLESSSGPFFISSDYNRNVFLWDFSTKRYIVKSSIPQPGQNFRKYNKSKSESKNHISLTWHKNNLYTSTVSGEVLSWSLSPGNAKFVTCFQPHMRPIYNMETIGDIIITSSHDRNLCGYDIVANKSVFQVQTIGSTATTMAFCPHDAHRLACGMQEGAIRILTFKESDKLLKSSFIYQSNRDKVLALSWHPCHENLLLFGTNDGKVGVADVCTGKVSNFAYFHAKSVYKVEWARPLCPKKSGLDPDEWYAYSFGDREIVIRDSTDNMKDPVNANTLLGIELKGTNEFSMSEFAFSPDFDYLALGAIDGVVKLFNRVSGALLVNIHQARKTVQHLLWKPPSSADTPYLLAIGSAETVIYIVDLETHIKELSESPEEPLTLTSATKELSVHSGRVVWLSWSCHKDGILASASYDKTIQIWNTNTGEPLHNYGGHAHRVFRVEFSPIDPDLVFSFGEENSIHQWRPSKITNKTPRQSVAAIKSVKPRRLPLVNGDKENKIEESLTASFFSASSESLQLPMSASTFKRSPKSLFPMLHTVSSRKKAFIHLCILTSMEYQKAKWSNKDTKQNGQQESVNDLNDDLSDEIDAELTKEEKDLELVALECLEEYKCFIPKDAPVPPAKEICQYLNFFGEISDIEKVITEEILNHDSHENFVNATILHSWKGSLELRIRFAANHKLLDAFLVSLAPQVSLSLWEFACTTYAEQLSESGQPVNAATYYLAVRKEEEAINLLIKAKHFREALTIARYRMGFNQEVIERVINEWISLSIFEGNFELACTLQLSQGNFELAARLMSRRTEPGSLVISSKLYESAQCTELALSTAVIAIKDSAQKHDFAKISTLVRQMPALQWFKAVQISQEALLGRIKFLVQSEPALEPFPELDQSIDQSPPLQQIISLWKLNGIDGNNSKEILMEFRNHFSTVKMPNSMKQLWFFLSCSVTEMLLLSLENSPDESGLEEVLSTMLKYVDYWDKTNQTFLLAHILLYDGCSNTSVLSNLLGNVSLPSFSKLQHLYICSETSWLLKNLEFSESHIPWESHVQQEQTVKEVPVPPTETINQEATSIEGEIDKEETDNLNKEESKLNSDEKEAEKATTSVNVSLLLPSFLCIEDFITEMKNYVSFWNSTSELAKSEESNKLLSQIVIKLGERSAIGEAQLRELLTIVSEIQ